MAILSHIMGMIDEGYEAIYFCLDGTNIYLLTALTNALYNIYKNVPGSE